MSLPGANERPEYDKRNREAANAREVDNVVNHAGGKHSEPSDSVKLPRPRGVKDEDEKLEEMAGAREPSTVDFTRSRRADFVAVSDSERCKPDGAFPGGHGYGTQVDAL